MGLVSRDLRNWRTRFAVFSLGLASGQLDGPALSHSLPNAWQAKAAERFSGPWNQKFKNKVFIIGNTLDPITPFRHAKAIERAMGGNAVLLQHEGYGHCSSAQPSACTTGYIQQFFINGTYPEKGTKCKGDGVPLFPGTSQFKTFSGEKTGAERLQSLIAKYNTL
ncbi:TAP-like protein-domain-containing protein [Obelidium mucronatum]|nr:TAP-like protein-domain-containing protein [Obelidium mucronatum]